ncbi:hypothetical protein PCASD_10581 [Puccinia coronata f. sp. avenae]|uniref:Zn(2)-C6 fungal-type domain-containing protein n=1 Tax=Puccinia coronata f. sp. avenae TaxID=200324 RepID=A0A2N5UKR6_9BASI|nr:hypothetical protein PCASD_10581 [Puccinia coronata f. sp. avenae]
MQLYFSSAYDQSSNVHSTHDGPAPVQDKPKRRRYRIPRSCDRCRSCKVKCVLENDCCNACAKLGLTCSFANPGSLRERPPTLKDVEQLSARIRSLERLVHAVDPTLDLGNLPNPHRFISYPNLPTGLPTASTSHPEPRSDEETSGPDSPQSQLAVALAVLHGHRDLCKPTITQMHWAQSNKSQPIIGLSTSPHCYVGPNAGLNLPDAGANFGIPNLPPWDFITLYPVDDYLRLRNEQCVSSTRCFYPKPDLERDLIKIYFQNFHPFVPIIHPKTFCDLHNSGLADNDPTFRALCLLMFSIASKWSTDPRVLLDLAGNPQTSRQFAGLRYGYAGYLGIFKLGDQRTTLFHLQAFVLLTIGSLATSQPTTTWLFAEQGLLRAQECGAHREVHQHWNADPLHDYLRRQAFFELYEQGRKISHALSRVTFLKEEDFDVEPAHVHRGDPLGMFLNPYSLISPAAQGLRVAFDEVKVLMWRLGSLRSTLPLLMKMQLVSKESSGREASVQSLKAVVDELDLNMRKWFDSVSPIFKRPDIQDDAEKLVFSVMVITCYQKFQMLVHRNLFHYQEEDLQCQTIKSNPHVNKCAELAISSITEMDKLRSRNLLISGFYWMPPELIFAIIMLACSTRRQCMCISFEEEQARRKALLLAIAMLDEMAPSTHTAAVYSKTAKTIYSQLNIKKTSVGDAFSTPSGELEHDTPFSKPPPATHHQVVSSIDEYGRMGHMGPNYTFTTPDCNPNSQDNQSFTSWDPLGNSVLAGGADTQAFCETPDLLFPLNLFPPPLSPHATEHQHKK